MLWSLDWSDELVIRFAYFEAERPVAWDEPTTYAGDGTVAHPRTYEWNHGIAEVGTALGDAGLRVTALREHRELEWQGLPHMTMHDDGLCRLPAEQRDLVPLMRSITAARPA